MKTHVFKRTTTLALEADVRVPVGAKDCPVLLLLHGGGLIAGGRRWFPNWALERFAAAGFATVAVDYRLAPETSVPEIVEDVRDAVAWTRQELPKLHPVDPDKLALVGYSAGGYLALLAGTWTDSPRPSALVSYYGYCDMLSDWYSQPAPHYQHLVGLTEERARRTVGTAEVADGSSRPERLAFYFYTRKGGSGLRDVFGVGNRCEAADLAPYRPLTLVDPEYPPTLLVHGDRDKDVPVEQSMAMQSALSEAGVANEIVIVPGADHAFDLPAMFRTRRERTLLFLAQFARPLLRLLPRKPLPGRAPPNAELFMAPTLSFLDRHLDPQAGVQSPAL